MKKKKLQTKIENLEFEMSLMKMRMDSLEARLYTQQPTITTPNIPWGGTGEWTPPDVTFTCSMIIPCA